MHYLVTFAISLVVLLATWWLALFGTTLPGSSFLVRYFPYGVLASPAVVALPLLALYLWQSTHPEPRDEPEPIQQWRLLRSWLVVHTALVTALMVAVAVPATGQPRGKMLAWAVVTPGLIVSFAMVAGYAVRIQSVRKQMDKSVLSPKVVALLCLSWLVVTELALIVPLYVLVAGRRALHQEKSTPHF